MTGPGPGTADRVAGTPPMGKHASRCYLVIAPWRLVDIIAFCRLIGHAAVLYLVSFTVSRHGISMSGSV